MINIFGGINHNVSWGGEAKVKSGGEFDYYPNNLSTYFYVVTALKNRTLLPIDPKASYDDIGNQFGNHFGSIDLAVKFQSEYFETLIYRQSMYETGRIISLALINDGLSGVSIKLKKDYFLNNIGIEYLYSANQGNYTSGLTQFFGLIDTHKIEIDNYMNNGGRGSWGYMNKPIGTPIFIMDSESIQGGDYNFSLNAIKSIHVYLSGKINNSTQWKLRFSNSGYASPRNHLSPRLIDSDFLNQISTILSIEKRFSDRLKSAFQLGYDQGERVENTLGGGFSVKYLIR
jgi:hypothetical protein